MDEVCGIIERLVAFASARGLIGTEDLPWARNVLLDAMGLEAYPATGAYSVKMGKLPPTATELLAALSKEAVRKGLIPDEPSAHKELFQARLMGLLTPPPSTVCDRFSAIERAGGTQAATDWFYALCRDNNYIHVDDIARNVVLREPSPIGELVITINLSKPEKDPKAIALERLMPASGYPRCQLCVENTGYAGRLNFSPRQNHRMIPLSLGGRSWHFQYSPYLYYDEHCIVLNDEHLPMRMDISTFLAMFDFVDRFPHYFIGSNADLPIVGGSILSHDHFQGGRQVFPMTKAPIALPLRADGPIQAGVVAWPLTTIRLASSQRRALIEKAMEILETWRAWSDEGYGILSCTDAPHNAVTPTLRQQDGLYTLDLTLRNNRVSGEHPLGIFHPHGDLHHIKRENIGLIEVMGLFILPGRLLEELALVQQALSHLEDPAWPDDMAKHLPWLGEIRARRGAVPPEDAQRVLRQELAAKCARVLSDCGVYPNTVQGREALLPFLAQAGLFAK